MIIVVPAVGCHNYQLMLSFKRAAPFAELTITISVYFFFVFNLFMMTNFNEAEKGSTCYRVLMFILQQKCCFLKTEQSVTECTLSEHACAVLMGGWRSD